VYHHINLLLNCSAQSELRKRTLRVAI